MCHWIRIVSQLMFKCSYFDFVYCDFDVNYLVFEIQMSFYCHLFLSANVRHSGANLSVLLIQITVRDRTVRTRLLKADRISTG